MPSNFNILAYRGEGIVYLPPPPPKKKGKIFNNLVMESLMSFRKSSIEILSVMSIHLKTLLLGDIGGKNLQKLTINFQ